MNKSHPVGNTLYDWTKNKTLIDNSIIYNTVQSGTYHDKSL